MRNSSHSSHQHVGEGASDDSDSSNSAREDSDCVKETALRPPISPYQATTVIHTTPSPLSHIAGRQKWPEDKADNDKGELPPSLGSLPNYSIISLRSLRTSDIPSIPLPFSLIWRRRSSILVTFPLSIPGGSKIGVGCTIGIVTSFRLSSSHPLANVPLFYRCCAIGKPVWVDPYRLGGWVDHDGVRSKTEPTSCDITIG